MFFWSLKMHLDAWQTIWVCVAFSVIVLLLDGLLAQRAGATKTELARKSQRTNRMARQGEGNTNE
jgi:hypothetical protein